MLFYYIVVSYLI